MRSIKEKNIDSKLLDKIIALNLSGKSLTITKALLEDEELQAVQEYANTVSIVRLGFNDHGPVHMRKVADNAIIMLELLKNAGVKTNIEKEGSGDFEDSLIAVILGSMMHDLGMSMGRQNHELHSMVLSQPLIDRFLDIIYADNLQKKIMIRSVAMEGIAGHMGSINISSLEAGIIQVADGCDMTKGRARIPIALANPPRQGHIHQYSANSIEKVDIKAGIENPVRVDVFMSSEVGLFQVEEVLMHKIAKSTAKQYIELYAQVSENDERRYL